MPRRRVAASFLSVLIGVGATGEAAAAVEQLARFDIQPWAHGWSYYARFGNWIGVLVTAVFISLGAPFWFNFLRGAKEFGDMLGRGKRKK